jgi:very-short-patch-repair endonuclease
MTAHLSIAQIAAGQHGMVTRAQLREAGVGKRAIARFLDDGWLLRRHVGVYQLGVFAGPFGPEQAALLACGPRAVLGHWTSIGVFELGPRGNRPVEILLPGGLAGQRPGIRPHRATALPACDVVLRHGLRVTTPARTLLDLAASTPRAVLERLTEEAQVQKLASTAELLAVIERGARRPGVRKLRAVVDLLDEPLLTRSEAERRLIALCRAAALPLPRTNVRLAGWEVDAVWNAQRLVVEVDGFKYHGTHPSFERDRRKDADLTLAGYRVLRLTWRRITREPDQVIALIAGGLRI